MNATLARAAVSCLWVIVISVMSLSAQTPNLSGTWRLDHDASRFTPPVFSHGRGGASAESLYITHATNGTLTVGTETNGAQAWVYKVGGERDILWGQEGSLTVVPRWDGRRLVVEGSRDTAGVTEHLREVFSLSADGQTLTVEITTTTPDGPHTNSVVYTSDSVPVPRIGTQVLVGSPKVTRSAPARHGRRPALGNPGAGGARTPRPTTARLKPCPTTAR